MTIRRAVLLDLDGTLTDSKPGIIGTHHAMLRELGHEPDPAIDLTFVIGPALDLVIPQVLAHYGDDRGALGVEIYRRHYGETGLYQSTLYPGVPALLQRLAAAGCQLFLATAKRTDFARTMLETFGLSALFSGIYGSEPGGTFDHKTALIAHILAQGNLAPADCIMVGDRSYDIAGARANGVRAYGVLWGYGSRAELEQAGADRLVRSTEDLAAILLHEPLIRAATAEDLPGILDLYRAFASHTPAYDAAAAISAWSALTASGLVTVLVAEHDGTLAATCTLAIVPNLTWQGHPYAVIENVTTHADHRRTGLGRAVLAEACTRAWKAGCYKVTLSTGSKQESTLAFYESAGFTRNAKTFFEVRRVPPPP